MDAAIFDEIHAFWFGGGEAVDADIARRFSDALVAVAGEPYSEPLSAQQKVGRIVLIDQLSRNIHRNRADAYSLDHFARQVAHEAIRAGLDRFKLVERVFVILPLGHSESLTDQDLALDLFLWDVAPFAPADNRFYQVSRIQSQKYRDIIACFGRFPQRNAILGRTTTVKEAAFMADAKLSPF